MAKFVDEDEDVEDAETIEGLGSGVMVSDWIEGGREINKTLVSISANEYVTKTGNLKKCLWKK